MSKVKRVLFLILSVSLVSSLYSCAGMQGGDIDRSKYEYRATEITDDYADKIKNKYKQIKKLTVTPPGEYRAGLIDVSGVLSPNIKSSGRVSADEAGKIALSFLKSEKFLSLYDSKTEFFYQIAKAQYSPMYNDYKVTFMKYLYKAPFDTFIEIYITAQGSVKRFVTPIYPTSKEFFDAARSFKLPVYGVEDPIKKHAKIKIMDMLFPSLDAQTVLKEEEASILQYKRDMRKSGNTKAATMRKGSFFTFGKLRLHPDKPFLRYKVSVDGGAINKQQHSSKPKGLVLEVDALTGDLVSGNK